MWQPIETAPKDGSGVLLFIPGYPGEVQAAVWDDRRYEWCLLGCEGLSFPFGPDGHPTRWWDFGDGKALPDPPND